MNLSTDIPLRTALFYLEQNTNEIQKIAREKFAIFNDSFLFIILEIQTRVTLFYF